MSNIPSCLRTKYVSATRTKAVIALITIFLLLWFFLEDFLAERDETINYRNVLNMGVDGNEFWSARDREQGLSKSTGDKDLVMEENHVEKRICKDFFVLWPGDCVESHQYLDERMRTLSAQMSVMNATLSFFTTDSKECSWDRYTGINVRVFNATEELLLQGFAEVLPYIDKWDKTRYTRLSDILRLCLAHRYEMSYLDSDVHFLQLQKGWYERPYVGAQLWSDNKNAIEITNAAFCLPRNFLEDMMSYQKSIVMRKKDGKFLKYFYTELGPSMFHHVLFNRRAVAMYSQNNPKEHSLNRIARDIHFFAHKQLHLTGRIRKGNKGLKFDQLVNAIRKKSGLPELNIIAATASVESAPQISQ